MTLVVPYLKRDGLRWKLEGRSTARQALLTSGLLPMLAAPTPSGACPAAPAVGAPLVPCLARLPCSRACAAPISARAGCAEEHPIDAC